jgi:hypothetical protein
MAFPVWESQTCLSVLVMGELHNLFIAGQPGSHLSALRAACGGAMRYKPIHRFVIALLRVPA